MIVRIPALVAALVVSGFLVACSANKGPGTAPTSTLDLVSSAAAEATALVRQAEATAIVLAARAQATTLVEQARSAGGTPTAAARSIVYLTPEPTSADAAAASEAAEVEPASPDELLAVEIMGVDFAAEGGMIMVRFLAPPKEAEKWWPGNVSVTDEGSGAVFDEIPVLPKVGPIIGRPKVAGQPGYVMLVNAPPYLQPGALVTVVLGAYRFEHIPVE